MLNPKTPVIIGVGQSNDRIDAPGYKAWSASDLAAEAARTAIADAGASGDLAGAIEVVATTRTFEDSSPAKPPFGKSSNFPRSIARRLGIDPAYAVWEKAGGNSPQDLVSEFASRIGAGEFNLCLVTGAEAISTVRSALASGRSLDFAEDPGGEVEDRGFGLEGVVDPITPRHGVVNAPLGYALFEQARRHRLGLAREKYARTMGELFAPFAAVAHANPHAAWQVPAYSAEDLVTIDEHNRLIADPFPLRLVARDQVNQGAAILIASLETARAFGIPDSKLVYLHGHARAREKLILERPDLGASPAASTVARAAIDRAGISTDDIDAFDFYSCFPIAVFNVACDGLGIAIDDPRGLTVTGGLPFFGGPGNNYSMHAIASMVERLRARPGTNGFIGANGGFLSKYSAGVYSTTPRDWDAVDSTSFQDELDAMPSPQVHTEFTGEGSIESYTVHYAKGVPQYAVAIGRDATLARFIARSTPDSSKLVHRISTNDCLGMPISVRTGEDGVNTFDLRS